MASTTLEPLFPQSILPAVKALPSPRSLVTRPLNGSSSPTPTSTTSTSDAPPDLPRHTSRSSSSSSSPTSSYLVVAASLLSLYLASSTLLSLAGTLALYAVPYGFTYLSAMPFILTDSGDRTNGYSRLLTLPVLLLAIAAHLAAAWSCLLRGPTTGLFGPSWFLAGLFSLGLTGLQIVTMECVLDRDFARK